MIRSFAHARLGPNPHLVSKSDAMAADAIEAATGERGAGTDKG